MGATVDSGPLCPPLYSDSAQLSPRGVYSPPSQGGPLMKFANETKFRPSPRQSPCTNTHNKTVW